MSVMLRFCTLVWMSHEIIRGQAGLSVVPEVDVFLVVLNMNVVFLTVQKDISRLEPSMFFYNSVTRG